jgi:uncharacterized protein (TIGR02246 family)
MVEALSRAAAGAQWRLTLSDLKSGFRALAHVFLSCVMGAGLSLPAWAAASSEAAVAATVSVWVKEWNVHDANALGQLLSPNVDFVGVSGALLKGRSEFTRVHAEQFAGRYDKSIFAVDGAPSITFIKPAVPLVHRCWTISDVRNADDKPAAPYHDIFTWIVVASDGMWKIRASQNTIWSLQGDQQQ